MPYGVEIRNSSNVVVLDESSKVSNVIVSGSVSVTANTPSGSYYTGTSSSITFTGMTTGNGNEYEVWLGNNASGAAATLNEGCTINRGTDSFTITLQSLTVQTLTIKYMGIRF